MLKQKEGKNNIWEQRWKRDSYIPLVIVLVSISLYIHPFFSNTENTFTFFSLTFQHGFISNESYVWFLLINLIPAFLFSLWFIQSNHAWRYYILFPLSVFVYDLSRTIISTISLPNKGIEILFYLTITAIFLGLLLLFDKYRIVKRVEGNFILTNLTGYILNKNTAKNLYGRVSEWLLSMENKEPGISKDEYLKNLFQTRQVLDEELVSFKLKGLRDRKKRKLFEILSCLILVSIPVLYILSRFIPIGVKSYSFGWFSIHDHGFADINYFIIYIRTKIFALLPLMIWFISSRTWWRHAILIPIILFTYQIWEILNLTSNQVDQYELLKAAPAILFIVALVLYISNRIKYQYKMIDIYQDIVSEIDVLLENISRENTELTNKKKELDSIRSNNNMESLDEKKASLIKLKEALIDEMNSKKKMEYTKKNDL
ncbi:hypothetical protein [Sediminicola sp. 1XM1-17]|uniref:hypothetical protein n=1 Tax=Sediminicola sp. 1XM1-17 TaxID=3127702 RepID=UPI0030779DCD